MVVMTTSIQNFTDPQAALAHVTALYDAQIGLLRDALQRFVNGETFTQRVRARYPQVRVHSDTVARADSRLAYGFVAGFMGGWSFAFLRNTCLFLWMAALHRRANFQLLRRFLEFI